MNCATSALKQATPPPNQPSHWQNRDFTCLQILLNVDSDMLLYEIIVMIIFS